MIPSNFRIEILEIRTLLCALGTKGLIWSRLASIRRKPYSYIGVCRDSASYKFHFFTH